MQNQLKCVPENAVLTGWDFSTGAVKCLAFDLDGNVLAETRFPTELAIGEDGSIELNLLQLEGQARQTLREITAKLRELGRLDDWLAGGISATHHTAGRIDELGGQIRRAICWNDQTLAEFHALGMERLGGPERVQELLGGPWAIRYTLSHLVKDELKLSPEKWNATRWIQTHGGLSAGYLTGNFGVLSVSSAASTGLMDFRTKTWRREMLGALADEENRLMAWNQLPEIIDCDTPVGCIAGMADFEDAQLPANLRGFGLAHRSGPLIFPTSDDQQAGLVGGGAVNDGEIAVILGNSAVVNSSCAVIPPADVNLDVMALNWGPYLLMRCYSNGAFFIDRVLGPNPDFAALEKAAEAVGPGANGARILPFIVSEPSLGVNAPNLKWIGEEPTDPGVRYRACLEALAYLIALGVEEHRKAGCAVRSISVSGGLAKSGLMCKILASVLKFPLRRLKSQEGPALGAAVTALSALENHLRKEKGIDERFTVQDAVLRMVQFRETVEPVKAWEAFYEAGLEQFKKSGVRN